MLKTSLVSLITSIILTLVVLFFFKSYFSALFSLIIPSSSTIFTLANSFPEVATRAGFK